MAPMLAENRFAGINKFPMTENVPRAKVLLLANVQFRLDLRL